MSETNAKAESVLASGCLVVHHVWTKGCTRCEHNPPPQLYDAVIKSLRHATLDDLCEDDGNAYPLIDMLSDAGKSVASGIARAEQVACDTAFDIWPTVKAYAAEATADADAELSRLTARIEELEKALKPFADFRYELVIEAVDGDPNKPIFDIEKGDGTLICCLTSVDFELARSTLEASDRNGGTE